MENRMIDRRLGILREKFLRLSGLTIDAVRDALISLASHDTELAAKVVADDENIDRLEIEIDQLTVELFALEQPAAHDLRLVIAVSKVTPILERIGDHATNIARIVVSLEEPAALNSFPDLPVMSEQATDMLVRSLDAFVREDAEESRNLIVEDRIIDAGYKRFFGEVVGSIISNPASTNHGAQMLFVAKHLERIGDYVKDICELTVYLREAVFIKHLAPDAKRDASNENGPQ